MRLKTKKTLSMLCAAAMTLSLFSACSKDAENENETGSFASSTLVAQVLSIDGSTITAITGELSTSGGFGGDMEMKDGEAPSGSIEMPEGEAESNSSDASAPTSDATATPTEETDSIQPPEIPDGGDMEMQGGEMPSGDMEMPEDVTDGSIMGRGGSAFTVGNTEISFEIADTTVITVELLQGSQEGTIDSIAVGDVLEITFDDNSVPTAITVKNLSSGGGIGGSDEDGEVPDASDESTGDD